MVGPEREVADQDSSVDVMTRLQAGGIQAPNGPYRL